MVESFVLLSLGANLGNQSATIKNAINCIRDSGLLTSLHISSEYSTEPVGYIDQPWFTNIAVSGFTTIPITHFLLIIKTIEQFLGRTGHQRWHEREIDIDLLIYGDNIITNKEITIPHPRMHQRRFVLEPAAEIASEVIHPGFNLSISQLLEQCSDNSIVNVK
ncbi:MAG: folK [Ignavibacteria bacterium]|nr:folK [Ignavibacteria bacterium]